MIDLAALHEAKAVALAAHEEAGAAVQEAEARVTELAGAALRARAAAGARVFGGSLAADEGAVIAVADAAVEAARAALVLAHEHRKRCQAAHLRASAAVVQAQIANAEATAQAQWKEASALVGSLAARDGAVYIKFATLYPFEADGWRQTALSMNIEAGRLERSIG